jgi:hypothetical protein
MISATAALQSATTARRVTSPLPEDLAAVAFTVSAAFVQTPGPAAGQAISPAK